MVWPSAGGRGRSRWPLGGGAGQFEQDASRLCKSSVSHSSRYMLAAAAGEAARRVAPPQQRHLRRRRRRHLMPNERATPLRGGAGVRA